MNATEAFVCIRYPLRVRRGTCAAMYRLATRSKARMGGGGVVAGESPTASRKCQGCPVGRQHAAGSDAPDVEVVQLTAAVSPGRKRVRLCMCGTPAAPKRRWCSLACASDMARGREIAYEARDLVQELAEVVA